MRRYYLQNMSSGREPLGIIPQNGEQVEVVLNPGRRTEHPLTEAEIETLPELGRQVKKKRLLKVDADQPIPTRLATGKGAGVGKAGDPDRLAALGRGPKAAPVESAPKTAPKTRARSSAGGTSTGSSEG